jgi:hypothetical protein
LTISSTVTVCIFVVLCAEKVTLRRLSYIYNIYIDKCTKAHGTNKDNKFGKKQEGGTHGERGLELSNHGKF